MKMPTVDKSVVLYEQGFDENDILQRSELGQKLSNLVNQIDGPFVVAVDGQWGTGKTYFLQRWLGAHEGGIPVYFDAFANDYIGDPLPGLITALTSRMKKSDESTFQMVKEFVSRLSVFAVRKALDSVTSGISEEAIAIGQEVQGKNKERSRQVFSEYWKREEDKRTAMVEFKAALSKLANSVSENRNGATLIFVVDELDRCRPDYALEVLEIVKHFFDVPRVHFVVGVNMYALECMVRNRYGNDIDAHQYLSKFFHTNLELPHSIVGDTEHEATLIYFRDLTDRANVLTEFREIVAEMIQKVQVASNVSLRDIEKIVRSLILSKVEMANPYNPNVYGRIVVAITLILSEVIRRDLYPLFRYANIEDEQLRVFFGITDEQYREFVLKEDVSREIFSDRRFFFYLIWLYVCESDEFVKFDENVKERVIKVIKPSMMHFSFNPKKFPREVYQKWLV